MDVLVENLRVLLRDDASDLHERSENIPNEEQQREAWAMLTKELKRVGLPDEEGNYRMADPDEFMLMHMTPKYYHFKHRKTRNYIGITRTYVKPFKDSPGFKAGTLVVLGAGDKPFHKGKF
jgi:hypothetical protein